MTGGFAIRWAQRAVPLEPTAVVAEGPVARRLVERLLRDDANTIAQLEGVAAPDLIVIAAATDALPWVDGVTYLGRDPAAPALLLPTRLEPNVPAALIARALDTRSLATPVAVLLDPPRLVSLASMLRVTPASLERWRAQK